MTALREFWDALEGFERLLLVGWFGFCGGGGAGVLLASRWC